MVDVITDPDLLKRLEAASQAPAAAPAAAAPVVTDPALLERLKVASTEQAPQERSWAGKAASFLGAPTPGEPTSDSGINATIGRVATGIIGGVPDMAIKVQNAGLNPFDMVGRGVDKLMGNAPPPRIPEVTPLLRQATGTPELPADASVPRRFLEGAATVAGGGGAQAVGKAIAATVPAGAAAGTTAGLSAVMPAATAVGRNIVAPVVGSEYGGSYGEYFGGEKGQVLGSLLGGMVGNVPGPGAAVERYYGGQRRPGADVIARTADRQGVTPTAGMLGNENIQSLERDISGRGTLPGTTNPTVGARERTLVQMREAADRTAAARGAQHPQPTPSTIGERVLDTTERTAEDLRAQSSAGQQQLFDRVGPNAPVDVSGVYAALRSEIGKTDPGTARPLQARLDALEQMMPRDRRGQLLLGPNGEIQIPYQRMKDWRSNLGRGTQVQEPVSAGHHDQIYGAVTDAMREAAQRHGVSPAEFDAVQSQTRGTIGSGGPAQALEKIAGKEGTAGRVGAMSPERAFNRVVDEQNPQNLQLLERHADPAALDRIAGDTLRLRSQESLGQGGTGGTGAPIGGGARGPANFANWWETMSPEAKRILGGPQAPSMQDLSTLAGAFDYPTRQTGLTRAMGGQLGGLGSRFAIAELLGKVSSALGLGSTVGRLVGYSGLGPAINYAHGSLLQSDMARRGMSGNYSPTPSPTIADLLAQLTAAGNANR